MLRSFVRSSVVAAILASVFVTVPAHAQPAAAKPAAGRTPGAPAAAYVVRSAAALAALDKTLAGAGSKTSDLLANAPVPYTVQVQHEEGFELPAAEIHDGKDHVIYILDGKTTFHIGGELAGAHEISPGEWRGPKVAGKTQIIEAAKGDLVVIPRGTPHFRTGKGSTVSLLSISIYSGNAPATKK